MELSLAQMGKAVPAAPKDATGNSGRIPAQPVTEAPAPLASSYSPKQNQKQQQQQQQLAQKLSWQQSDQVLSQTPCVDPTVGGSNSSRDNNVASSNTCVAADASEASQAPEKAFGNFMDTGGSRSTLAASTDPGKSDVTSKHSHDPSLGRCTGPAAASTPSMGDQPIPYYFYPNSEIPVFLPSMEQFKDFSAFVTAVEPLARKGGLCKVVPPPEWRKQLESAIQSKHSVATKGGRQRAAGALLSDEKFPVMRPIVQHFNGSRGTFHQFNVEYNRRLELSKFFSMCMAEARRTPSVDELVCERENKFKRRASSGAPNATGVAGGDHAPPRAVESDVQGVVVDYSAGNIKVTSAACNVLRERFHSVAKRDQFLPPIYHYHTDPAQDIAEVEEVLKSSAAKTTAATPAFENHSRLPDGRLLCEDSRVYGVHEAMERLYWNSMLFSPPMYGADVPGTLFPPPAEFPYWNPRDLGTILRRIHVSMPGVNEPYLYLGMWRATFAWHVEDMDLYSINYNHFGAPKSWFAIPLDSHERFERCAQSVFAHEYQKCNQFLRHKEFILSPSYLAAQGVPVNRVVQRAGEFILTFPHGYHSGFNYGFNCAESVNFALEGWLDIGKRAERCKCIHDSVAIDFDEWFPEIADTDHISGKGKKGAQRRQPGSPESEAPTTSPKKRKRQQSDARTKLRNSSYTIDPNKQLVGSLFATPARCSVCLQPVYAALNDGTQAEEKYSGDAVVTCSGCPLTAHVACSGVTLSPGGRWTCAKCKEGADEVACQLCPFTNGVLQPTPLRTLPRSMRSDKSSNSSRRYVHMQCASFVPEVYFDTAASAADGSDRDTQQQHHRQSTKPATPNNEEELEPVPVLGLNKVPKRRWDLRCVICNLKGATAGAGVQCAHPKCYNSMHPTCAILGTQLTQAYRKRGQTTEIRPLSRVNWEQYQVFCPAHSVDVVATTRATAAAAATSYPLQE